MYMRTTARALAEKSAALKAQRSAMQKAIDALLAQKAEGDARVRALVEENDQLTERQVM